MTPNPLHHPVNELATLASFAQDMVWRLQRNAPSQMSPVPQPITASPNVAAAEGVLAILNGTATQDQRERHLVRVMSAEVKEQINDQVWLDRDSNERGQFQYVASDTIEIELCDEAYLGWVADERPGFFSGETDEGDGWEATSTRVIEGTNSVRLILRIEGK